MCNYAYVCQDSLVDHTGVAVAKTKPASGTPTANGFVLTLINGDLCSVTGQGRISVFTFSCNTTEMLTYVNESPTCTYNFVWLTPLACPWTFVNNSCALNVTSLGLFAAFDLSPLAGKTFTTPDILNPEATVDIFVCDPAFYVRQCGPGIMICSVDGAVGYSLAPDIWLLDYNPDSGALAMDFAMIGGYSSTIIFVCSYDAGAGAPVMVDEDSGDILFVWQSVIDFRERQPKNRQYKTQKEH